MIIYEVTEYITKNGVENASGVFSSLKNVRQAVLDRIADVYTDEEIAEMDIPEDWRELEVPSTDYAEGCTYTIYTYELDKGIE